MGLRDAWGLNRKKAKPEPKKLEPVQVRNHRQLAMACGHTIDQELVEALDCEACAAIKAREAKKLAQTYTVSRLPDGANYQVFYDAAAVRWRGKLTVPGVGEFCSEFGALFKLLENLDRMYRKAVGSGTD